MNLTQKILTGSGVVFAIILLAFIFTSKETDDYPYHIVERGKFEILVPVTGELEAENSVSINAPGELQSRNIRLRSVPIQDLIPEGTEVEEGDWVATLDRTEAELSLADLQDQMLSEEAQYNATILDTTIRLSNLRDELINLEHSVEEMRLVLEQSAYEPPATIRQAEINLEKAKMDFRQARENYVLYELEAVEIVREAELDLERRIRRYEALDNIMDKFVITSPGAGMIMYHREWSGEKRSVGSNVHSRDLTVAVIPDLRSLVSRAFVNEIDVDIVSVGQTVRIGIDAYPERSYTGSVVEVANVGQELPNMDAKVFEVMVKVDQIDNILRPAMTTSNVIVTASYDDVHFVPMAAVHQQEGVSFVYRNDGTRQIVVPGPANDNYIIIEQGLEEGELVYLTEPENHNDFEFVGNELIADGLN